MEHSNQNLEFSYIKKVYKEFESFSEEGLIILNMPYTTPSDSNYKTELDKFLTVFIKVIENLKDKNDEFSETLLENITTYRCLVKNINDCLNEYLRGNYSKAFTTFKHVLDNTNIKNAISQLLEDLNEYYYNSKNFKSLYRMRECENNLARRGEIFHIPYEKRYLVKPQRYSLSGVPCLYLGSSTYVCWLEMGQPDLNKTHISRFQVDQDHSGKILNIAFSFYSIIKHEQERGMVLSVNKEQLNAIFLIMPLLIACSFKTQHKGAFFNIEHVIPSMFLEWVQEQDDVVGLKYLTTKTRHLGYPESLFNYVFPAKEGGTDVPLAGFSSSLKSMFLLSHPLAWQFIHASKSLNRAMDLKILSLPLNEMYARKETYPWTKFGDCQDLLNQEDVSSLE